MGKQKTTKDGFQGDNRGIAIAIVLFKFPAEKWLN